MLPKNIAALVEPPFQCARVISQDRGSYLIVTEEGEMRAEVTGAMRHTILVATDFPIVGDYVAVSVLSSPTSAQIHKILPRKNVFARRGVDGSSQMQMIASNLDTLMIAVAANNNFNLRRLERYVIAAASCKIEFAIVLTKSDLIEDAAGYLEAISTVAREAPVIVLSAFSGNGLAKLMPYRGPDKTIAFVGSSGVGKSTLINCLLNEEILAVKEIRQQDEKGRHTTTRRLLLRLEDGTCIIDTPGMKEFALADAESGLDTVFGEVTQFSQQCRFRDCRHDCEPGCAVKENMEEANYSNWRKLEREAAYESKKHHLAAEAADRERRRSKMHGQRKRS